MFSRRFVAGGVALCAAAGLCWLALPGAHGKDLAPKVNEKECTGDYGTSVHFLDTPKEAARQAEKEQKLVMILHVSGNFEDSGLT